MLLDVSVADIHRELDKLKRYESVLRNMAITLIFA